jgi:hypothetical protein
VVFPVREIGDEILAHFLSQIPAAVGVEAFPSFNFVEIYDGNREQLAPDLPAKLPAKSSYKT